MITWFRKLFRIESPLLSSSECRWLAREIAAGRIAVRL